MRRPHLLLICLLSAAALGLACHRAVGQEKPFGPVAGPAPAAPAAPRGEAAQEKQEDPVVLAIRESSPTTPAELMRAVEAMMNYGRLDEAKRYLDLLVATKPTAAVLSQLHRQFGTPLFLRMLRQQELAPEGAELAQQVIRAAAEAARDPARLAQLARQLSDPSPTVRSTALTALAEAGTAAATPLVQVLADPRRAREHAAVRDALVALGNSMIDPLLGVLETDDEALLAHVINVLGRLQARQAVPYLIRPLLGGKSTLLRQVSAQALVRLVGAVPARSEGETFLFAQASAYYAGKLPGQPDHLDQIVLWQWDAHSRATVPRRYSAQAASLAVAARLARDLHALKPANEQYLRLYLSASLEAAKLVGGLDRPLARGPAYDAAAEAGPAMVQEVLKAAMEQDHVAAAVAACEVLGQTGNLQLLQASGGQLPPLVEALRHGDRRLRLAAAETILRLDPQRPFAGCSYLTQTLGFVIRTAGQRRLLIGHPRLDQARSLVGALADAGIEADTAATGRELLQLAFSRADYDWVLLSDAVDHPNFKEVVQMLRRDPRTAALPVGLVGRPGHLRELEQLARLDPLAQAFPWPYEAEGIALAIGQLTERAGPHQLRPEEKIQHALEALDAMIRIAQEPDKYGFYNVMAEQDAVIEALQVAELSARAAQLLGLFGAPAAQRALVDLASNSALPLARRQAAAEAFAAAVRRRGLLLTTDQIRRQYDRYNQSEVLDRQTQQLLGSILDTIEARRNAERKAKQAGRPS